MSKFKGNLQVITEPSSRSAIFLILFIQGNIVGQFVIFFNMNSIRCKLQVNRVVICPWIDELVRNPWWWVCIRRRYSSTIKVRKDKVSNVCKYQLWNWHTFSSSTYSKNVLPMNGEISPCLKNIIRPYLLLGRKCSIYAFSVLQHKIRIWLGNTFSYSFRDQKWRNEASNHLCQ